MIVKTTRALASCRCVYEMRRVWTQHSTCRILLTPPRTRV